MASAVRIGTDLLVTNRHVMANESHAEVRLPGGGSLSAQVVPSGYTGDLVLLRAEGLGDGPVLDRGGTDSSPGPEATLYAIGLDLASRRVRAFAPGRLILAPAPGHALARLYHSAASQPGTSGGALVDDEGRLAGFIASGGEGHNEAIPAAAFDVLLAERGPAYAAGTRARGAATRACIEALEHAARSPARVPDGAAAEPWLVRVLVPRGRKIVPPPAVAVKGRGARKAPAVHAQVPSAVQSGVVVAGHLPLCRGIIPRK